MESYDFRIAGGVCCTTTRDPSGAIDFNKICEECKVVARRAALRPMRSGEPVTASPRAAVSKTAALRATGPAAMRAATRPAATKAAGAECSCTTDPVKRGAWISAVLAEYPALDESDISGLACEKLERWAAHCADRVASRAAARAATAAKIAAAPPDVRAAALDASARALFGVDGDAEVFTDAAGIPDPYRSPSNRRTAREAARLVAASRDSLEARRREIQRPAAGRLEAPDAYAADLEAARAADEASGYRPSTRAARAGSPAPPDPYGPAIEAARKRDNLKAARRRR